MVRQRDNILQYYKTIMLKSSSMGSETTRLLYPPIAELGGADGRVSKPFSGLEGVGCENVACLSMQNVARFSSVSYL